MNNLTTRDYIFITAIVVLGVILIWYINKNKTIDSNGVQLDKDCYLLPKSVDPLVFGPKYWAAFHDLTHKIPCAGCRDFAEKFMIFFHDFINVKLGKNIYDVQNFNDMSELVMRVKLNNNTWIA